MELTRLSDAQLLDGLKTLCGQGRALLARVLAHLVEVEKRRLHLEAACPSMLQFCVRRLGMSEDEACRRIHAARLAGRFPDLLVRIERGDLTLSTMALLQRALTDVNYEDLVEAAAGKTKAEVQTLLAKRFPAAEGHRCPATTWLELDHVVPRARGGTSEPGNVRVRCRAHYLLYAEQTFGKEHVERKIRERPDPRERGYPSESYALAASGLANLGFRRADVQRALDAVGARHQAARRHATGAPSSVPAESRST